MRVTVFTPTYNRAKLIHRVYDSLMAQTCKAFEWLIIDDGSTDDTEAAIKKFIDDADFPIRYIKRQNKGKAASINEALALSVGEFFLVFDSDDWCTPNALERFLDAWDEIDRPDDYCAVSALKGYSETEVVGEDYRRMRKFGESYLDRFSRRVRGDKWEFIRTEIHRRFLYELAPGERYQAPEYAWLAMGQAYRTVFINEIIGIVEYQADGISKNNLKHRVASARSTYCFYKRGYSLSKSKFLALRCEINAARFALHAKSIRLLIGLSPLSMVMGAAMYFGDNFRNSRFGSSI